MLRLILGLIIIGAVVWAFNAVFHPASATQASAPAAPPAPAGSILT